MTRRRFLLATSVVAVTACGITAVGEFVEPGRPDADAGRDSPFVPLPDGADLDGGSTDANVDDGNPQNKCVATCDGGCDAGTCVIDCSDAGACVGTQIVCPAGIPCSVTCGGALSCDSGVDCTQASRCDIACTGSFACAAGVSCGGSECNVGCTGPDKVCDKGVQCDAGKCSLVCGHEDCANGPINCAGNDCSLECAYDAAVAEKNGCKTGVTCTAADRCALRCGEGSCQGNITVRTDGGATLECLEKAACKQGASGFIDILAADASILCAGDDTCEGYVDCNDAGKCTVDCTVTNDKDIKLCCTTPNCTSDAGNGLCKFIPTCQ